MLRTARWFSSKCHYELLGVQRNATSDQIKAAYYSLAKTHHPDAQQDSQKTAVFGTMASAYETLMDEEKRYAYDLERGYLNAMDVDRMEDLKTRYGSRYRKTQAEAKEMWKSAVHIDQALGEEVLKDPFFAPKALFRLLRKPGQSKAEDQGAWLDDIRIFRQMTLLSACVGFVLSYNATVWTIEQFLYPTHRE